jgi:hypothetical protein
VRGITAGFTRSFILDSVALGLWSTRLSFFTRGGDSTGSSCVISEIRPDRLYLDTTGVDTASLAVLNFLLADRAEAVLCSEGIDFRCDLFGDVADLLAGLEEFWPELFLDPFVAVAVGVSRDAGEE